MPNPPDGFLVLDDSALDDLLGDVPPPKPPDGFLVLDDSALDDLLGDVPPPKPAGEPQAPALPPMPPSGRERRRMGRRKYR